MAIYRIVPKCPFCSKVIAQAVYNEKSDFIGDSFSHWKTIEHDCKEVKNKLKL